jgi:putative phosphoesterase
MPPRTEGSVTMRVGLISDLHGNFDGTAATLRHLEHCDRILCAGDIFNMYGGDPRVVDVLRERDVEAVAGNHDVEFVRSAPRAAHWEAARAFLARLPGRRLFQFDNRRLHLVHGAPWDSAPAASTYLYPHMLSDPRLADLEGVLVVGHSHLPFVRAAHARLLVISPGSCGVVDANNQLHAAILDTSSLQVDEVAIPAGNHG